MTFEKHLRWVSRAASQRLGILRKSCRVFHDRSLLVRCFRGFVLLVLEYCSAVWCSLLILDRSVRGARFLTGGVFECDIAYRRSVALLCMLYKIGRNPMQPLYGVFTWTVPISAGHTRCSGRTSAYSLNSSGPQDLYYPSVSLWNHLADPVFVGVELAGFKSQANAFLLD